MSLWSISTGKQLLHRDFEDNGYFGVAISSFGGVVVYGERGGVEIVDIPVTPCGKIREDRCTCLSLWEWVGNGDRVGRWEDL